MDPEIAFSHKLIMKKRNPTEFHKAQSDSSAKTPHGIALNAFIEIIFPESL